jgi:hypothetical protein
MRQAVRTLASLGPLPASDLAEQGEVERYQELLGSISAPVTDEEAAALLLLFGPDDCFGLAWTLLHLIESSPGWPLFAVCQQAPATEWRERLLRRATA